ncbi:MAG: ThiF family adenylyltransferase [Anaerolineae bacterium]|nr:ThiF family adenylyltransferase [Anaerolineae bacterium]
MNYTLSLTGEAYATLRRHLCHDRQREQLAVTLCGFNRMSRRGVHELRLLVHEVILFPPDAFRRQSAAHLELLPEVQAFVHRRAQQQRLIQVDWHSHPGAGPGLAFSATDDHYESAQAAYLAHRMNGVPYGSVVVNDNAVDARLWRTDVRPATTETAAAYCPRAFPLNALLVGDLQQRFPLSAPDTALDNPISPIFDRQVRAFGREFQQQLGALRVGVVGLGGMGSAIVEYLARMGVRDWVLVDPDVVDITNLNRLVHAGVAAAQKRRPKVCVARSVVRQIRPRATIRALQTTIFDPAALRALKTCDLLIAATDNHSSRMALNRLAVQYLIPLVHVGFNISVESSETAPHVTDVSGEFAIPDLGHWCLHCAGLYDPQLAGWELATPEQQALLQARGYVNNTPSPAVRHLDGLVTALAAAEIHNLVHPFKPAQRYLVYDALKTELTPLQMTATHTCPVCGAENGVLGLGDLEPLPDYTRAAQVKLPPVLASPPAPTTIESSPAPDTFPLPSTAHFRRSRPATPGDPRTSTASPD